MFGSNYGRDERENSAPINEGDEYDVKIEDLGRDGDGITRIEGFVVFVSGAKVGDEVKIKVNSVRRNFGFADYDDVVSVGTNGKMNEVSAAMGLTSLESLDRFIAINYRNYKQYRQELEGIPGVQLVTYDETERCNYQHIILEVNPTTAGLSRDRLKDILWAENVLARRYFYPGCHRMEPYRSAMAGAEPGLPETERLAKQLRLLLYGKIGGQPHIVMS